MGKYALACVVLLYAATVCADGPENSADAVEHRRPRALLENDHGVSSWGPHGLLRLKRGAGSNNFGNKGGAGSNNFGQGRGAQSSKGVFTSYNNDKSGSVQGKRGQGKRRKRGTASNNFGNSWGPGANNFGQGGGGPGYNGGYGSNGNDRYGNAQVQHGNGQGLRNKRGAASNNFGYRWGPGSNNFGVGSGGPGYNGGYNNNDRIDNVQGQKPVLYRLRRGTASNNFGNTWGPGANNFGQIGGGPGYNGGHKNDYEDRYGNVQQGQGH